MIEQALVTFLKAAPSLDALVADRIGPIPIPAGDTGLWITYQPITLMHLESHDGINGLTKVRMQLNITGTDLPSVFTVRDALHSLLLGCRWVMWGSVRVQTVGPTVVNRMDYQPETKRYTVVRDYEIWYEGVAI